MFDLMRKKKSSQNKKFRKTAKIVTCYFLDYKKNIRFDFDEEWKIRDVSRYKHLT